MIANTERTAIKNVTIIPAKKKTVQESHSKAMLKVAAYCRVSTELEEQQSSFETQVTHYTNYVESHDGWMLAGMYADEGLTGTSMQRRPDFRKMIDNCRLGHIDMIITKSVSRFARNARETLDIINELRSLGIAVYFEKESINTMNCRGDLTLTLFAAFAEEESRSISENVRWGKRKKMELGHVHMPNTLYGYERDKEKNKEWIVIDEEAEIIRKIYCLVLKRYSFNSIKDYLNEHGFRTRTGKKFGVEAIIQIVNQEKYAGDYLTQKTFSKDFRTKEQVINRGELPQVYIQNHHTAIISHDIYNACQEEQNRRNHIAYITGSNLGKNKRAGHNSKYAFSGLIFCAKCSRFYSRKTRIKRDNKKQHVWMCSTRRKKGSCSCSNDVILDEQLLYSYSKEVFERVIKDYARADELLMSNIESLSMVSFTEEDKTQIEKDIAITKQKIVDLYAFIKNEATTEQIKSTIEKVRTLENEQQEFQKRMRKIEDEMVLRENHEMRMKDIKIVLGGDEDKDDIDDKIRRLINKITVLSYGMLEYEFTNGTTMKYRII